MEFRQTQQIVTVRFATAVFNKKGEKKGILIYNIDLGQFFKDLDKTTLYNVHLIDGKGRFLLNSHNNHGGILGKNFEGITIFSDYGTSQAQKILENRFYRGKSFYTGEIEGFNNNQHIKMILDLKYGQLSEENLSLWRSYLIGLIVISFLLLPFVLFFGHIPDILRRTLYQESHYDKDSDLPNRLSLFEDLSTNEFKESVIVIVHVDNYIKIQNIYGYEIVSLLVMRIAKFLNEYNVAGIDKIYHSENNMFFINYNIHEGEELSTFLKEFHQKIENYHFEVEQELEILLDITMGISDPNKLNNSIDELKEAEIALELALDKRLDYAIYDNYYLENIEKNKTNMLMSQKIKWAIEDNGIFLEYQPIYNNRTKQIEKYEVLMRLKGECICYPDTFIQLAKDIKKYRRLTDIMIDKAFKKFANERYEFSINLCANDINDDAFSDYFLAKIEEYQVHNRLVIEIVESENILESANFYTFIKKVKEYGCKIAIDDFGSGFSNFLHIIELSDYLDYIKIDGSLIKNVLKDDKLKILVQSIQSYSKELNIKTIAEYVENEKVVAYLTNIGVDYSQGYYIGKPGEVIEEADLI